MKIVLPKVALLNLAFSLMLFPNSGFSAPNTQTLYKCIDASGVTLYTNQKVKDKKCTAISVPVPPPPSKKAGSDGVSPAPTGKTKTPTPADFPRVSGTEQKGRDNDRRAILDRELATERTLLEKAKTPSAAATASPEARKAWQDSIALHERNIEALNKEIARLQ
jgi:hypothetical protein